jgi:glycosyltransferase involved in cell wall biosynthesis
MEIAAGWTGVAGQMRTATEEAGVQISVIIPAFNRADLIEATLATVYAQTLPGVEVVVVDDGSTDETAAILRRHAARVRYVHQENSGGCSRGRNVGIRESRGRYIAIFDSDDLMAPAKLEKQVAFLERHPAVDFVFTDFVNFEDDREDPPHTHGCPRFREALRHCRVEEDGYILPQAQAYELLLTENYIGASGMVFRRSLAERSGGFDESFASSEDREFALRVARTRDLGFVDVIGHRRRIHTRALSALTERVFAWRINLYRKERRQTPRAYRGIVRGCLADAYFGLAWYRRDRGRAREAIAPYLRAIALRPGRLRWYGSLGRCLYRTLRGPRPAAER